MRTSKEFIEYQLGNFAMIFPNYTFKYWMDLNCGFHFVEVIPSDLKLSGLFRKLEIAVLKEFYSEYFDESLRFGCKDDMIFAEEYVFVNTFYKSYWPLDYQEPIIGSQAYFPEMMYAFAA